MILYFVIIVLSCALAALGVAGGLSRGLSGMLEALERQPAVANSLFRMSVSGMMFVESCFLFVFVLVVQFVSQLAPEQLSISLLLIKSSAILSVGIVACLVALALGNALYHSCHALVRQPFYNNKIQLFLLIILALIEMPIFLTMCISLAVMSKALPTTSMADAWRLASASLTMGLGSIGTCASQILFVGTSCRMLGYGQQVFVRVLTFTLMTEALLEMPVFLAFLTSILLSANRLAPGYPVWMAQVFSLIALILGIGSIGACLGMAWVGRQGVRQVAANPKHYFTIFLDSLSYCLFIEAIGLCSFIVSLLIWRKISF